jgi:hypothetical protein
MKLLFKNFLPSSWYFLTLKSKYWPQHAVVQKHPDCERQRLRVLWNRNTRRVIGNNRGEEQNVGDKYVMKIFIIYKLYLTLLKLN